MKMKHITLVAILFAGLICLTSSTKSKQLFEVVNQELSASNNNNNNHKAPGAINSIFEATEEEQKSSNNEINFAQKSESRSLFAESDTQPTKSLFGDSNDSHDSEANKFLNKHVENLNTHEANDHKVKSLFEDEAPTKSLFGDNKNDNDSHSNSKANKNGAPKSLFEMDEEPIKPQVKLNETIKPQINSVGSNKNQNHVAHDNHNAKKNTQIINKNNINNNKNHNTNANKNINSNTQKNKKPEKKPVAHTNQAQKPIDDKTLQESKSEIEKLKSKVVNLISINKQLVKELDKKRKLKKKSLELSDDLINLIETHQSPIIEFEQDLKKTQVKSAEKLQKKETELKQVYGEVRKNLDVLVGKLDYTKTALKEVKSDESLMSGELKKNYSTDSLTVLNNAQVEGSTKAYIVNAESLDVGNIKVDLEKIMIANSQTEIIVGSDILSVKELVENLDVLEKLRVRCGENLEKCVQYNEEHFENDMRKQNEIIEELKKLRRNTKDIIHRKD